MKNKCSLIIILGFTVLLFSGCTDPNVAYLYIDLLGEDRLLTFDEEYVNLTQTELSQYKPLEEAIMRIIDPLTNLTSVE